MEKKTILIGMTNLGAAHKQSAVSIGNAIREKYGNNYNIEIIDVLSESKTIFDPLFKQGYRYLSNHLTFLYAAFFYITNIPVITKMLEAIFEGPIVKQISKLLVKIKPDIIVSTYPIFPLIFHKACKRIGIDTRIIALIMDYKTGHNSWFLFKDIDSFLIPNEECYLKAISMGIPEEKIIRVGIPLALKFSKILAPDAIMKLRAELGCEENEILALIAGGGEGIENAYPILKHIIRSGANFHPVVVCGRNKALKKRLDKLVQESHSDAKIFGFINNMYELMNAADIIISKGGYLTINEAFFMGKPLIIAAYVPGQEKGNVEFVRKNNLGYYIHNSEKLVEKIKWLSHHKEEIAKLKSNIEKMHFTNGTREIADIIVNKL